MELHLEGRRAVITHEGQRYECRSPLMRPGDDGLIVGRKQIAGKIRVDFRRSEGTVIATVYEDGKIYTLRPVSTTSPEVR